MENVILVIHLLLAIGLVGVVLLQRSEGGGLGIGGSGGGGGMSGFMTGRATADLLTRTTAILATAFMVTSPHAGDHRCTRPQGRDRVDSRPTGGDRPPHRLNP